MRRDKSEREQVKAGAGAHTIGAHTDSVLETRASRLGVALSGMAHDLAAAHREIAMLKRENAALRGQAERTFDGR